MIIITLDFLYMVLQCAILWGKIIFRMIFPAEFEPMKGKIILVSKLISPFSVRLKGLTLSSADNRVRPGYWQGAGSPILSPGLHHHHLGHKLGGSSENSQRDQAEGWHGLRFPW